MRRREASEEEAEGWWPWPRLPPAEITVPAQRAGGMVEEEEGEEVSLDGESLERASADSALSLSPEERKAADVVEVAPELLEFLLDQKMWACFELAVSEGGIPSEDAHDSPFILLPSCIINASPHCQ